MRIKIVALICVFGIFVSCSSTKTKATPEQIKVLDELVKSKSFMIKSEWALPFVTNSMIALQNNGLNRSGNSANRISLHNISNELKLVGSTISSQLPYYGEVQMPSGYMNSENNDIVFDGDLKNLQVIQNKDSSYTFNFDAKSKNENYGVTITIFPNLRSEMTMRGAKRNLIRYTGRLVPFKE